MPRNGVFVNFPYRAIFTFKNSAAYILFLTTPAVSSASPESIVDAVWASKNPKERHQSFIIQWISVACSAVSTVACLVVLLWFFRMEKRFRHRLIMILMYGDLIKGIWFLISACVFLVHGSISTASSFCQLSGFFIQYGTQTSDYAILAMAIHSAIEVFYPSTLVISDGLYPWRYYVYVGALMVPSLMAGLAFVNPDTGYWAMGAYCMLPIRPFWYRLALAWIPRYIIVLLTIGLAIAIYTHVGFEFRRYSTVSESMRVSIMDMALPEALQDTAPSTVERQLGNERRASSMAHDVFSSNRPTSFRNMKSDSVRPNENSSHSLKRTASLPKDMIQISPRLSVVRPALLPVFLGSSNITPPAQPLSLPEINKEHDSSLEAPSMETQVDRQRRFISRQLRLLFIYPLVYTLMWLIPFIQHCTFYQDRWAQYPMYPLRVANITCLTLMGFVDCVVFSLREKPWRNINNNDGTFWGSLNPGHTFNWNESHGMQRTNTAELEAVTSMRRTLAEGPVTGRFRSNTRASASDDFARIAASQARARLNLEIEERRARFRRESTVTEVDVDESSGSEPKRHEESREL